MSLTSKQIEALLGPDVKHIDLTRANLDQTREAIKMACEIGAKEFVLYVNPLFLSRGLILPNLVKLNTSPPVTRTDVFDFVGLTNLVKTFRFAREEFERQDAEEVAEVADSKPQTPGLKKKAKKAAPGAAVTPEMEQDFSSLPDPVIEVLSTEVVPVGFEEASELPGIEMD